MAKNSKDASENLRPLQKLSLFFFSRPKFTALLCVALVLFGAISYTSLLKREGFPSIETPFAISQGTYLVGDAQKVDQKAAGPLSEFLLEQPEVDSVLVQSFDNFFVAQVAYKSDASADEVTPRLQKEITDQKILPDQAKNSLEALKFGYTPRGDNLVVSFYAKQNVDENILISKATRASEIIESKNLSTVESASIINPFEEAVNPATGKTELAKKSFDRFGTRQDGQNNFYRSVVLGIKANEGADSFELLDQVQSAINEINASSEFSGYGATISAADAPQVDDQISELQKVLLEALVAILIVGSLIIAFRASLITIMSMFAVLAITIASIYAIGATLNTITLFALILSLALIVDDTIIMIEALDNQRRRLKKAKEAVSLATRKVSRAMIAATLTAALSFAPLLFVGGIIGDFIRAVPYTIITALFISLLVALIFIPLFAKLLLFNPKFDRKKKRRTVPYDTHIVNFINAPLRWSGDSFKRLTIVGSGAFFIGVAFIVAGLFIFTKVTFNIFPAVKDSNLISVSTNYPPNTSVSEAEQISSDVENIVSEVVGENFDRSAYFGEANQQSSMLYVYLTKYSERDIKSPEIIEQLDERFADFDRGQISVNQIDAGPPAMPFVIRVASDEDRTAATRLASDIADYMKNEAELKRIDGSIAKIDKVTPPNPSVFERADSKEFVSVSVTFLDTDTSTLVNLAETAVKDKFNQEEVQKYGLQADDLSFSSGQEDENQESFATLALAFPLVMLAIYILLVIEFRSLMQPLIIFMAIPFSLFGVALGLYLTNNSISFFTMMAFFALIGLSIKNTILLVDFANQARRDEGMNPVDAIQEALNERFRPLIATSFTAVVSLIPLALTSPFWEGLAVTLMFGLLSSTMLVILIFPYYFLGAEYLRIKTGKTFKKLFAKKA